MHSAKIFYILEDTGEGRIENIYFDQSAKAIVKTLLRAAAESLSAESGIKFIEIIVKDSSEKAETIFSYSK